MTVRAHQFPSFIFCCPRLDIRLLFSNALAIERPEGGHHAYMSFQDRYGGLCQFLEGDLKTPLPNKLHFASAFRAKLPKRDSRLHLKNGAAIEPRGRRSGRI